MEPRFLWERGALGGLFLHKLPNAINKGAPKELQEMRANHGVAANRHQIKN